MVDEPMRFFVGLHQPSDAKHFDASFLSVNRLKPRRKFAVSDWIMDSGAFTEIARHGRYRHSVEEYAAEIARWHGNGNLLAAVAQDYMCEAFVLEKTGCTVEQHQQMTVERYDALRVIPSPVHIMPVLQGYKPTEYVDHIRMYGDRLRQGMWVGVGSVCKRNGNARSIEEVLLSIHHERPDLKLHGFGLKTTALRSGLVRLLLATADSMAWSFHARRNGRNANDWQEAQRWLEKIESQQVQLPLFIPEVTA
jgi:hypothetical protein